MMLHPRFISKAKARVAANAIFLLGCIATIPCALAQDVSVAQKTDGTDEPSIREIAEREGKQAAERKITRRVIRPVKSYVNAISCEGVEEIGPKDVAALAPYREITEKWEDFETNGNKWGSDIYVFPQ
jgi:hypothetical protein